MLKVPVQGNILGKEARVTAFGVDYGLMTLMGNSSIDLKKESGFIALHSNEDFRFLAFSFQRTALNAPQTFSGTMDVVFIGPRRPHGKDMDKNPNENYFEDQIDCTLL